MDIKAEDFPIYQVLAQLHLPGITSATKDFESAVNGGDNEKYSFALGMQSIASSENAVLIPGVTEEAREKTLRSCISVFEAVSAGTSKQSENAKMMANYLTKLYPGL